MPRVAVFVAATKRATVALTAYRYYRLNMTANNGGSRYAIAETEFILSGTDQTGTGTASASSVSGVGEEADKAFDDDIDTQWVTGFVNSAWLQYDMGDGNAVGIDSYTIAVKRAADEERAPKDWTFEGSDDSNNWTILHTVTGETGWSTSSGTVVDKRTFTI